MDGLRIDFAPDFENQIIRVVRPKLERLRDAINADMHRDVPVDTGDLKRSLFCTLSLPSGKITGGATMHYAAYVEFGTSQMRAQPYIRPAFLKRRGEIR